MADAKDADKTPDERVHAIVHGIVQGVNYRYYTIHAATQFGLVGWVRNRPDGTVETVAEGSHKQLEAFVNFLHDGSPSARVSRVEVSWLRASGDMDSFDARY
jgi:acylphosphatase